MKPYASPPLMMMLGFLSGWQYARPSILLSIVWAAAHFAMVTWIMRDIEASYKVLQEDAADG